MWNYYKHIRYPNFAAYFINYPLCMIDGLKCLNKIFLGTLTARSVQTAHISSSAALIAQVHIVNKAKSTFPSESIAGTTQPSALFLSTKRMVIFPRQAPIQQHLINAAIFKMGNSSNNLHPPRVGIPDSLTYSVLGGTCICHSVVYEAPSALERIAFSFSFYAASG